MQRINASRWSGLFSPSSSSLYRLPSMWSARLLSMAQVDRSAEARNAIFDLWKSHGALSAEIATMAAASDPATADDNLARRKSVGGSTEGAIAARALMATYQMDSMDAPRGEDVTPALGEAFDRLLLLLVPFDHPDNAKAVETLLRLAGKHQRSLGIRTTQHLFARCQTFGEALSLFHAFRKGNVQVDIHSYYAMLFCLQRLEEESWALRFREELNRDATTSPAEEAMQFIIEGCPNQLIPENKPWLGRVVFADADPEGATRAGRMADFDALGEKWLERYAMPPRDKPSAAPSPRAAPPTPATPSPKAAPPTTAASDAGGSAAPVSSSGAVKKKSVGKKKSALTKSGGKK